MSMRIQRSFCFIANTWICISQCIYLQTIFTVKGWVPVFTEASPIDTGSGHRNVLCKMYFLRAAAHWCGTFEAKLRGLLFFFCELKMWLQKQIFSKWRKGGISSIFRLLRRFWYKVFQDVETERNGEFFCFTFCLPIFWYIFLLIVLKWTKESH